MIMPESDNIKLQTCLFYLMLECGSELSCPLPMMKDLVILLTLWESSLLPSTGCMVEIVVVLVITQGQGMHLLLPTELLYVVELAIDQLPGQLDSCDHPAWRLWLVVHVVQCHGTKLRVHLDPSYC